MAQLRAKQIKLASQDDLLIGGANGNGAVLSKGGVGTVLKVLAGGALGYEKAAAADTTFTGAGITATDVQAAIVEVKGLADAAATAASDEATRATAAEGVLAGDIADLQTELDATQTGAGLGADGAYTADATTNYLKLATSLFDADKKLDAKLKDVADLAGAGTAGVQAELDAVENAVGLAADGTFDAAKVSGSDHAGVAAATTVLDAVMAVDAALAAEEAARDQAINQEVTDRNAAITSAINAEVTARDAAILVETNRAEAEEASIRTDFAAADTVLDGKISAEKTRAEGQEAAIRTEFADADSSIQNELDATQAGAGLGTDGAYAPETTSNYINSATTLKGADMLLDAAIKALDTATDTRLDALESSSASDKAELEGRINDLNTALGVSGDDYTAITGSNYLNASTSFRDADLKLDAAVKAVDQRVTALGAAFNYVGTVDGGATAEEAFNLDTLLEGGKDAGDYYKVTTSGYFQVGEDAAFFANANDGLVWNKTGGVDIIDNSNSQVQAGANIKVTGSTDTGFTVALDGIVPVANGGTGKAALEDVTADSAAIVLSAGAAGSVVNGFTIGLDASKIDFADLNGVNAPAEAQQGKYLKWTDTGLAYVTAAEIGVTVHSEEDFEPTTAANASVTLTNAPSGDVSVFINGVKLKKTGFSVTGTTVTLIDSVNGYGIETGDTVSVSYNYAA